MVNNKYAFVTIAYFLVFSLAITKAQLNLINKNTDSYCSDPLQATFHPTDNDLVAVAC